MTTDRTGHATPGKWASRLDPKQHNPEELKFAEEWRKENVLHHLLGDVSRDGHRIDPREPTEAEATAAATVVQWLGSNVGRSFLERVGYVKKEAAEARGRKG